MADPKILEEVLSEADILIRQRLKEHGIEIPHLVVAVTPDGQVMWHANVSPDGLRSFGEDLINVAEGLEAPSAANDSAD